MSSLKELASPCFTTQELDLHNFFTPGKSIHFLQYSEADAKSVGHYHNYKAVQEQAKLECEAEVIKAIKGASDRFVTIGCSPEYPMVIIDMFTREYNVIYGFGEQRRGYGSALRKQGFKANPTLRQKTDQKEPRVVHCARFDVKVLGTYQG